MKSVRTAALLLMSLACSVVALAQTSMQVEVTGAVKQAQAFDAAALAAFPAEATGRFTQSRNAAGNTSSSTVRGVKLTALVERVGLAAAGKDDWKTLVVIATATDGYRAVFSWAELSNTPVGEGVLVVFERDGKPLDEREGRISMVSGADLRTGPRHVRNLARIEVRALN